MSVRRELPSLEEVLATRDAEGLRLYARAVTMRQGSMLSKESMHAMCAGDFYRALEFDELHLLHLEHCAASGFFEEHELREMIDGLRGVIETTRTFALQRSN